MFTVTLNPSSPFLPVLHCLDYRLVCFRKDEEVQKYSREEHAQKKKVFDFPNTSSFKFALARSVV